MALDHREREIYYDGKSITLFAPKVGYYASVPAPPTIGATIATIQDKYGVEILWPTCSSWASIRP